VLKGSSTTFQHAAATAAAAVVVRPSRRRVLKRLGLVGAATGSGTASSSDFTSHTKPDHLRRMTCLLGPAVARLEWCSHLQQV
jgi:hypothetical protein